MSQKVLSDEAQKAIDIATEYAQDNNHNQLDGAHILWSILKYTEFGQDWLNINNVDISIVQKLEDSLGFWYRNDSDQTQASSTYIRIMQTAFANSSNAYITVTHLLHVVIEVDTELMAWLSENGIQASTMVLPASTPRLNEFGRDITRLARQGKLPIVIGREEEQQQITEILLRHGKNNVLLLGDPGVGKTSVIEQLAQNIVNGTVPEKLKRIRLVEISTNNLVSGTVYRGQFEERLSQILAEITEAKNIIIVIDEFHTLVGSGTTVGSSLDAANILKPALARGELTCIGITTYDDYSKHIKKDAALSRRFENVSVLEPSEEETRLILDGIVQQYEDHHSVKVETVALDMIVQLAARYLLSRRFPDKAIDILSRACSRAEIQNFSSVDSSIITSIVSELAGTPVMGQLESSMQQVLSNLQETLQQVVIGQEKAVNTVSQAIRLSLTGLRDSDRPKGVFMFVGPSGVGKTELAKSLAQILFGTENALIRLDMSEFSSQYTVSRLIGSPPGYVGYDQPGQLTQPLSNRPFSVVLLDEVEKAHPDVFDIFLQLFDEGRLTDAQGNTVDGRHAIFIMTSNLGTQYATSFSHQSERMTTDALRGFFKPEFLNRVDSIIHFRNLDIDDFIQIAHLELDNLKRRMEEQDIKLTFERTVADMIAKDATQRGAGARGIARSVENLIAIPASNLLIDNYNQQNKWVHAECHNNKIVLGWV